MPTPQSEPGNQWPEYAGLTTKQEEPCEFGCSSSICRHTGAPKEGGWKAAEREAWSKWCHSNPKESMESYWLSRMDCLLSSYKQELEKTIGEHNARILNQYQLCELGRDESVLFEPIEKATKETFALLRPPNL